MILQSLANYYLRRLRNRKLGENVAPYGMEYKEIKFIIEITKNGDFINLVDLRDDNKKGQQILVPKGLGRSGSASWKTANLLWDHYGYVLGQSKAGTENPNARGQLSAFIAKLNALPDHLKDEEDIAAVIKFYQKEEYKKVTESQAWPQCNKIAGCNMTFRIVTESCYVTENPTLMNWVANNSGDGGIYGRCLVTGEIGEIARTHAKVSIGGSQATLVGFQKDSGYDSYGKEQGYNAPVSQKAEFNYTTALNMLLSSENNRVRLGDTTLLFWAEPKTLSDEEAANTELAVKALVYGSQDAQKDKPDIGVANAKNIFEAIFTGRIPTATNDRFCVLGIAPNKARLSVVFWKSGTIKEIAVSVMQFYKDVELLHRGEPIRPSVYEILRESEYQGKMDNVPSNMIPAMVYSIFNGAPFPSSVFGHVMGRLRAERKPSATRVAFLKAYLNRKYRNTQGDEITVSLDKKSKDAAYRLGRLMAVLQKIQEDANPGINATIMDRFYSSMSATPVAVLPMLLRLKNHHLAKLTAGRKVSYEKLLCEIFDSEEMRDIPNHLSLERQAKFAVGYYHQREDLFKSNKGDGATAMEEQTIEE